MAQATINVRMDENLKKQLEEFCDQTGFTVSSLFNIFSKTVVREQRIPFNIELDPFYSKENMDHIKKALKNLNAGKGVEHDLIEAEDE